MANFEAFLKTINLIAHPEFLKSDIASLTIEVIYSPRLRHGIWQIVTIKMAQETATHSSISGSSRLNAQWVILSQKDAKKNIGNFSFSLLRTAPV